MGSGHETRAAWPAVMLIYRPPACGCLEKFRTRTKSTTWSGLSQHNMQTYVYTETTMTTATIKGIVPHTTGTFQGTFPGSFPRPALHCCDFTSQPHYLSRHQYKMAGFECEFVEPPPKVIQTECPICLHVLREPYQATCCGKSFCKQCYEKAEENESSCPTCKDDDDFFCYHNKGLQLPLYDLKVYCKNKSKGCEWTGELRELDNHLNSDPPADKALQGCPYEIIQCPLNYAGCKEKLPREELDDHLSEQTVGHMLMQAKKHCTELQTVTGQKRLLEFRVSELKAKVEELKKEVKDLTDAQQVATSTGQPIGQVEFTMSNFEQHKADSDRWYSSHFYTHPQGYKMCLSVEANGFGNFQGTHISTYFHIMKGEFDDQLKWPYSGRITFMLVDQTEDKNTIQRCSSLTIKHQRYRGRE